MSRLRAGLPLRLPSSALLSQLETGGRKIKCGGENCPLARMAAMRTCLLLQPEAGGRKNKIRRGELSVGADGCYADLFAPANWKRAD